MAAPTYQDDTTIREVFQRMLDGWTDPTTYASGLAPDAVHIGTGGRLDRGRDEIMDGHVGGLSSLGRGSSKTGRIERLQFLTADVALLTVYGEIAIGGESTGDQSRRTIETITAQKIGDGWSFVTCQSTPLGHWPQSAGASSATPRPPADDDAPADLTPAGPTGGDEGQIRALYRRMLDCWLDAPAYAECFTPEADYITGGGKLERGWRENAEGHQIIFSAWARDSRLAGRIDDIRFLTADVAVLTAYGHIVFPDRADTGKRTIYTATAQKLDSHWIFVGYQNTPLVA